MWALVCELLCACVAVGLEWSRAMQSGERSSLLEQELQRIPAPERAAALAPVLRKLTEEQRLALHPVIEHTSVTDDERLSLTR